MATACSSANSSRAAWISPSGQISTIPTAGGIWRAEIVGVFPDYGNPKGQLRIDIDALTRRWPDAPRVTFWIEGRAERGFPIDRGHAEPVRRADRPHRRPGRHQENLDADLRTHICGDGGAQHAHPLVSAIALLASLTTLGDIRLAQVAPVWATGVPRRRLAQLELLKSFCSPPRPPSVCVAARARPGVVPGGGGQRAGLRLAPSVLRFPGQWLEILALALLTAEIAAMAPIIRFGRTTPAELARVFANER